MLTTAVLAEMSNLFPLTGYEAIREVPNSGSQTRNVVRIDGQEVHNLTPTLAKLGILLGHCMRFHAFCIGGS